MSTAPKPRHRAWRIGLLALALTSALLLAGALALFASIGSAPGTAWLLRQLPGLVIESPSGSLLGDFSARRLTWRDAASGTLVQLDGLRWQGLRLHWSHSASLKGAIEIDALQADRLLLDWKPSADPSTAPADLKLPLALQVHDLRVAELQLKPLGETLHELHAGLDLSRDGGAQHQLTLLALRRDRLLFSGQAQLASSGSMAMEASVSIRQALDSSPLQAQIQWLGPLAKGGVSAQLSASGQTLALQAQVTPFAPWPLASLSASAQALDLAALHSTLPHTALSGQAQLDAKAWDQPADLRLQLSNSMAGRWDQARLPLRELQLDLQLQPDRAQQLLLRELRARLGSAQAPAGDISAQGQIAAAQAWQIQAQLKALRTSALDARLADLSLDGSVKLKGRGLPETPGAAAVQMQAALLGRLLNPQREAAPVALELSASADAQRVQLLSARLSSGSGSKAGSLQAEGVFTRPQLIQTAQATQTTQTTQGWQARFSLQAKAFDPRLLWRGAEASIWQRSAHSLNAELSATLAQGEDTIGKTWPRGEAQLTLSPSQLGGLPLSGTASYRRDAAAGTAPQARVQLDVAGAAVSAKFSSSAAPVNAKGTARDALSAMQLDLDLRADQLSTLAPWLQLAGAPVKLAGKLQSTASLHWERDAAANAPWRVRSEGHATASALSMQQGAAPAVLMKAASLDWRTALGTDAGALQAPLQLQLEVDQLRQGTRQLSHASVKLEGSLATHRLQLGLQGQLGAAGWLQTLAKADRGDGSAVAATLSLDLQGGLSAAPQLADTFKWSAHLRQLQLRPLLADADRAPYWLNARELDLSLQFSVANGLSELSDLTLAPGRLQLAGVDLSWQQAQWQAARAKAEPASLALELQMDPLALAPLLARWQPDFGWGGNLVVGGKLSVRSRPTMELEIELLRASGDLSVTDERGVQPLGLTDLRLALSAHQGVWHLTEAFAGTGMGSLAGAISIRTAPEALWPAAQTPIEGVFQANVARLGTWGGWVPAGWRLGGSLSAGARVGGTIAAPEITGQAQGEQLALRNALLGVDVRNAAFNLSMKGSSATLERFSAQGGSGTVSAQGQAQLGAKPTAQLQIEASRFTLLSRVDRRLVVSGNTTLGLTEDALQLDGKLAVDEGLFDFSRSDAPTLDEDVQVLRASDSRDVEALPGSTATARQTHVDLLINLGQELKLRGRGIDTRLRGELRLTQKDGLAALNGVVRTEGGSYDAYGQKLEIEHGEFNFLGAIDNPRLDVLAVRPNTDTRVGVTLTGTALQPRIKLFSDPEMSETDKLSWLLMGRSPDGLGRADTALLQRAALALLSGEGESASGRLIKNLGLDELSVRQGESDASGTVVRLGKQLSRRWFVGYERGLNATTGSWQLIYRIAQRFTLRAQSGDDSAVDLIWQWRWH